jgi:SAM-dependent methyltransferase
MSEAMYDRIGVGYSRYRKPDPRIAAQVVNALGSCSSVLNVGAGAGSYEPEARIVLAIEPSTEMISQREPGAAQAVLASAERLPVRDGSFEASLAILTIHHWRDWTLGLREMQRVAKSQVVLLTWDPDHHGFWLVQEYFPEILEIDRAIFPSLNAIESVLGRIEVREMPIPADCTDGFLGAYWRRPSMYLDARARQAISTFAKLESPALGFRRLERDLASGAWQNRYGKLLGLSELDIGYRLVIGARA